MQPRRKPKLPRAMLARGRVVSYAPKEDIDFEQFRQLYRETVGMGVA